MGKITIKNASEARDLFLQADRFEEARQFKKAFRCFSQAAELGDAGSQLNLGNYYASGTGVRKNYAMAGYWYKKAFSNGVHAAARALAIDQGALGDVRSGIRWFKKGIEKKDGGSYILLARIYSEQRGGKVRAVKLLRRVSRLNRDQASELDQQNADTLLAEIRNS